MTTWIQRFDPPLGAPDGLRVAVKDAIDIAGFVTAAGCAAVRERAVPATADAACLAGVRAAGAAIVGKTTLTELCVNPAGDNAAFGTPVNPLAPDRMPGGSSSGSAVAVAAGEADIGLGTDTGGSVRIPAACCGIVGLKTTWGRVPTEGVWPLAPTLDTVGPIARTVTDVATGMRLLAPGWTVAPRPARTVGRLRIEGVDNAVEEPVDAALDAAGLKARDVRLPGWDATNWALHWIITGELWRAHHALLDADGLGAFVNQGLHAGRAVTGEQLDEGMAIRQRWQAEIAAVLDEVELLALPTLVGVPPLVADSAGFPFTQLTAPFNLAGVPALAMPVPSPGLPVPASLQLVGPMDGEDLLCATGLAIEAAGRR
ncbi:amidase [Micromonospora sp. CPCC 206061]|uniref:amidase n=1 Tax=Micromonospora sp. CPCC 206061 TaxID=3122410 RepID=UPI002FF0E675